MPPRSPNTQNAQRSPARAAAAEAFAVALLANGAATVRVHAAVAAQIGLSAGDATVLDLLARRGPLTPGELGAQTGLASASVTGLIDRLAAGGFVRRVRDPNDGRRVRVEAQTEGLRRFGAALATAGLDLEALAAPYATAELHEATAVLERATAHVRALLEAGPAQRRGDA